MEDESNSEVYQKNHESVFSQRSSNQQLQNKSYRSSIHSFREKTPQDSFNLQQVKSKSNSSRISHFDDDSSNRRQRFSVSSSKSKQLDLSLSQNYKFFDFIPDLDDNPKQNYRHQCICPKQGCGKDGCPCSLAINQLCVIGLCCPDCITKKNSFFNGQGLSIQQNIKQKKSKFNKIKRQNNHLKALKKASKAKVNQQKYDFVYCTCKKTQCMKKYCPCYALNKQCNECCICEDCQNCSDDSSFDEQKRAKKDKLNRVEDDFQVENQGRSQFEGKKQQDQNLEQQIDDYFEQSPDNYQHLQLNRQMDFEPVDFGYYRK